MKYIVKLMPDASADISDIFNYIANSEDHDAAVLIFNGIEKSVLSLDEYPERGHIPHELLITGIKRYLEIHFKVFRIIYEISDETVYIHAILDSRRNVMDILTERLLR